VISEPDSIDLVGRAVPIVRIPPGTDAQSLAARLSEANLSSPTRVVVLVGGAGGLTDGDKAVCAHLFASALIPVLEKARAYLVDGGTRSGVVALAGEARRVAGAQTPHIGVVAAGTVQWPGQPNTPDTEALEPNHTHVVLVPGNQWGDEAPWLSAVASALSDHAPSVTVLANGGEIAYDDVRHSLDAGRPVIVLGATGRAAADIASARHGQPAHADVAVVARSPLITLVEDDDPEAFAEALTTVLRPTP
jgi:SLOG in TRPM, prokaryote